VISSAVNDNLFVVQAGRKRLRWREAWIYEIWTRCATERGEVDLAGFDGRPRLDLALLATTIETSANKSPGTGTIAWPPSMVNNLSQKCISECRLLRRCAAMNRPAGYISPA
jgi:hypothetical protein